ncbi:M6 family metalloprotease domain-containing protein [Methylobacterium sp. SyP6R]|uniref:M6 family metalloprotease domain-containing protein n=1 Tax=Methylobacterium sp. SyP6R TaxID=2718876 RepID=UPI001F28EFD3|nr:M6 family metalloprotease domain-containing protein [Methylobacterium sp. SyP6R]MCF4123894.1 M6 family metalloprotease domain-containing protein [Methylobacterium sp. SyP6R]
MLDSIRAQVAAGRVLSTGDARLATRAGWLGNRAAALSGFNDGVVYPPPAEQAAPAAFDDRSAERLPRLIKRDGITHLHCLVLLVDFSDLPGKRSKAEYERLLFDPGNPGSLHNFYREMSYGRLHITGEVIDWQRAAHPSGYYADGQSGTGTGFPRNTPGLLDETLQRYCTANSLEPFDRNGDGFLDGLVLIHAGGGAEAEPDPALRKARIWSHKWTLPHPVTHGKVSAYAYFTAPEDGRLGVFAHEFGHFLGLPDLYDTSYRGAGIGDLCLMSGGSWAGGGHRPARMSAWCLVELGWVTPVTVTVSSRVSLTTLERDATASIRIDGPPGSLEYFLLENRQRVGRDDALFGSGLAIWHIDDSQADNANPRIYRVALIQADGLRDLQAGRKPADPADLFPGTGGVRAVDDRGAAHPHLRWNDGTASGLALSDITERDGLIVATLTIAPVATA